MSIEKAGATAEIKPSRTVRDIGRFERWMLGHIGRKASALDNGDHTIIFKPDELIGELVGDEYNVGSTTKTSIRRDLGGVVIRGTEEITYRDGITISSEVKITWQDKANFPFVSATEVETKGSGLEGTEVKRLQYMTSNMPSDNTLGLRNVLQYVKIAREAQSSQIAG